MLYKIRIINMRLKNELPSWANSTAADEYALVEADNIRTAKNLAIEYLIRVEKATELELVQAGRENWPIIRAESETATDDGQMGLSLDQAVVEACDEKALPTMHEQAADTRASTSLSFTPSTGSAPHWLPQNPVAQDTGD